MPKKFDTGSERQLASALGSKGGSKPETTPQPKPPLKSTPIKHIDKSAQASSKTNFQIRTTIGHDSELGKAIMAEAARINDLAGRELLSPNKLASEFLRDFNEDVVKLFHIFLEKT